MLALLAAFLASPLFAEPAFQQLLDSTPGQSAAAPTFEAAFAAPGAPTRKAVGIGLSHSGDPFDIPDFPLQQIASMLKEAGGTHYRPHLPMNEAVPEVSAATLEKLEAAGSNPALLEAMSERQVTVDDQTLPLPDVFAVLATQNPIEHHGAYPLPESQLDRFMARLTLGYPPRADERSLVLEPTKPQQNLQALSPLLSGAELAAAQAAARTVHIADNVADYLLTLVDGTRTHRDVALGCSPRGAGEWAVLARAWAFLAGRDFVLPDDVKALASPVLVHRLVLAGAKGSRPDAEAVVDDLTRRTPVPR